MFVSRENHILSNALIGTAMINICIAVLGVIVRLGLGRSFTNLPDLIGEYREIIHNVIVIIRLFLVAFLFWQARKSLRLYRDRSSREEYIEAAKLLERQDSQKTTALSLYSVGQLLQMWRFILVDISLLQEVSGAMYQIWIHKLSDDVLNRNSEVFVNIYNATHGFKYIGMITALIIAIYVTGLFLRDNKLKNVAMLLMGSFVIAFVFLQMRSIRFVGRSIGVVWTSVLFHGTETFGLLALGVYLRRK